MRMRNIALVCALAAAVGPARGEDDASYVFGSRLRTLGDIDGDGVADFVIGSRMVNPHVRAVSGKSGTVLWDQWGYDAVSVPDRNKDGCRDVLIARSENAVGPDVKDLWGWFVDGKTGARIGDYAAMVGGGFAAGAPHDVAELGDVDGDGKEDLLFTQIGWPDKSTVDLTVRSVDGALVASIGETEPSKRKGAIDTVNHSFIAGPVGDIDGDKRADLVVSCPVTRGLAAFEVRTAVNAVIFRYKSAASSERPSAVVAFPDADGDGTKDLLVGMAPAKVAAMPAAGEVRVLSGKDGETLRTVRGAGEDHRLGTSLAVLGDADGDGSVDFAAGAPGADRRKERGAGAVYAFSGKTGKSLWIAKGAKDGFGFGTALCSLGDIDGDGVVDLAAGSLGRDPVRGYVLVLSGKSGKEIRRLDP